MKANIQIFIGVILTIALIYWLSFIDTWMDESWYVNPTKLTIALILGIGAAGFLATGTTDKMS